MLHKKPVHPKGDPTSNRNNSGTVFWNHLKFGVLKVPIGDFEHTNFQVNLTNGSRVIVLESSAEHLGFKAEPSMFGSAMFGSAKPNMFGVRSIPTHNSWCVRSVTIILLALVITLSSTTNQLIIPVFIIENKHKKGWIYISCQTKKKSGCIKINYS